MSMDEKDIAFMRRILDGVRRADDINKRVIDLAKIIVVSLCLTITVVSSVVAYLYFTTDYSYPSVNQSQNTGSNINIKGKGDY